MTRLAFLAAAFLAVLAGSGPAAAQDPAMILAARQSGVIGERFDGYLGLVRTPSATIRRQVEAVNIRRRALYSNLAARRGVTPQEVGITAGCTTLAGVRVGEFYMHGDGAWRRRLAGQPAPKPNYCV